MLGRDDTRPFSLSRFLPIEALAWCVEHYWVVEWDLPSGVLAQSRVLSYPTSNLAYYEGRLMASGVVHGVFSYPLLGRGRVFGVKFRPGGLRPFVDFPMDRLTDRMTPAPEVWGATGALEEALSAADDVEELMDEADRFLSGLQVPPDPTTAVVEAAVLRLLKDPQVRRVSDVCTPAVGQRTLQRLFRDYVGVTPRWVLQRGRLHHAAQRVTEQAVSGTNSSLADVAVELGYADQAHFIHDFRRVLGVTPARYVEELRAETTAAQVATSQSRSTSGKG